MAQILPKVEESAAPLKFATRTACAKGISAATQTRSARQRLMTARLMLEAVRDGERQTVAITSRLQVSPAERVTAFRAEARPRVRGSTREEKLPTSASDAAMAFK